MFGRKEKPDSVRYLQTTKLFYRIRQFKKKLKKTPNANYSSDVFKIKSIFFRTQWYVKLLRVTSAEDSRTLKQR